MTQAPFLHLTVAFILLSLVFTSTHAAMSIPSMEAQCNALVEFYSAMTSGDVSWTNNSGWAGGNTTTCCSWYGVVCDDNQTAVTGLSLANNNLNGTLPSSNEWVQQLPDLQTIDLSLNNVQGTLPDAFANLTHLTTFIIERGELTGSLPLAWSSMASLRTLSLSYNKLEGILPPSYANITTLRWVYMGHNLFTGPIPSWGVCALLLCANTGLYGDLSTVDFFATTCVAGVQVWLVGTAVNGTVPCYPHVSVLDVGYTQVTGVVPTCPELKVLGAEGCNLTGWDTNTSAVASQLTDLYLTGANVPNIPADFSRRFPSLQTLTARNMGWTQELPPLPSSMQVLDIPGNSFTITEQGSLNISNANFQYMDISSPSVQGITLLETPLNCVDSSGTAYPTSSCAVRVDPFKAMGRTLFEKGNPASGAPSMGNIAMDIASVPTPMMVMFPNYLLGFHVILPFIDPWFSGTYRPRLSIERILPHVGEHLSAGMTAQMVVPWNNTYVSIPPAPSGIVAFDGLQQVSLLHGVEYRADFQFFYRPVRLANGELGAYTKELEAANFQARPCTPEVLYAVPLTTTCVACPPQSVCNGSSVLMAYGPVWRSKASYLPFYPCESNGCTLPDGETRLGTECAPGFTGPRCSLCIEGYGLDTTSNCVECSADGWNWTALVVAGVVFVGAATFVSFNNVPTVSGSAHSQAFQQTEATADAKATTKELQPVNLSELDDGTPSESQSRNNDEEAIADQRAKAAAVIVKMLQNHMGIFSMVGRTAYARDRQTASVVLQTIQQFASQVSLRSVSFVTCLFPDMTAINQFQALLIVIPSLVILELIAVRIRYQRWAWVAVSSSVLLLLYESAITITLQLIPTDDTIFYDASQYTINATGAIPVESSSTLSMDRRVTMTDEAYSWRGVAYGWLVVFGVGFPVGIISCYLRMTTQYGLQYAKDNLGFLTSNFRSKRWYWEEAIMLRKFAMAVCVIGLRNYPLAQMQAIIGALMLYVVGLEWQVPFSSHWLHHAERVSCYGALIVSNVLMAKGSLRNSAAEQIASYQDEGYTSFMSTMQVVTIILIVLLLYVEWRRSTRLGRLLSAEEGGVLPINLDGLTLDTFTFKSFSLGRVMDYLAAKSGVDEQNEAQSPHANNPQSVKDLL